MNIEILQDNTVHVRYSNGTVQAINSTHSHKARSPIMKAVCDALPYRGAAVSREGLIALKAEKVVEGKKDRYAMSNYSLDDSGEVISKTNDPFYVIEDQPEYMPRSFNFDSLKCTGNCPEFEQALAPFMPELTELKAALDGETDTPATKTKVRPRPSVEFIGGNAVVTMVDESVEVPDHNYFPVVDADGNAVADAKDPTKQAMYPVRRIKAGKPMSETKRKRLATLLAGE